MNLAKVLDMTFVWQKCVCVKVASVFILEEKVIEDVIFNIKSNEAWAYSS